MNHREIQKLLSAYLDNEVDTVENARVFSHLKSCAECNQFIEHAAQVRSAIQAIGKIELSSDFVARTTHLTERGDEKIEEWLGIEPLARNTFFAIVVSVVVMFFLTSFNTDVSVNITEVLIDGSAGDSIATQVLLQPGDLSKNDLLYAVMTK